MMLLTDLTDRVLTACDQIPAGKVASYGDIAAVVGTHPRVVGNIMKNYGHLTTWWRIVRSDGTSALAERAQPHWEAENTPHTGTTVDMARARCGFEAPPTPQQDELGER